MIIPKHRSVLSLTALSIAYVMASMVAIADQTDITLKQLASTDYEARTLATEQLLTNEQLTLEDAAAMYKHAVSPEQRQRLMHVARHIFLRDLRFERFRKPSGGALGIAHQAISHAQAPEMDSPAILVAETFPGFPAHGRLRVGDLLIGMNGQALSSNLDIVKAANLFTAAVSSQPAGTAVTLWVLRDRERHEVVLHLASHQALAAMYTSKNAWAAPKFEQAWQDKFKQMFSPQPAPTIKTPGSG